MAATENKVNFNLKNVHYAVITETVQGGNVSYEYGTPVPVPGAVSLTLDPVGETSQFYADGIVYFQATANGGYSGSVEIARVPEQMLVDVWGLEADDDGVIKENANTQPKEFALLYQIDGDKAPDYYLLYKCSAARPGIGSETTTETKEPVTQTLELNAVARADGLVSARTGSETTAEAKAAWFTAVHE